MAKKIKQQSWKKRSDESQCWSGDAERPSSLGGSCDIKRRGSTVSLLQGTKRNKTHKHTFTDNECVKPPHLNSRPFVCHCFRTSHAHHVPHGAREGSSERELEENTAGFVFTTRHLPLRPRRVFSSSEFPLDYYCFLQPKIKRSITHLPPPASHLKAKPI